MLNGFVRLSACVASGVAFLALTGCGGGQPDDGYSGPPPAAYDRGSAAPVLMGSTPSAPPADSAGLAGGLGSGTMAPIPNPADLTRAERASGPSYPLIVRRRADGTLEISMRPIANPEDMSAAERRRVYGNRYAPRPTVAWSPRRLWRGDDAPKPVARPAAKPTPVAKPVAKVAVAPAKPVVAAAPAPKPVAPLKTAPIVAPAAIAPTVAAKPAPKLTPAEQLSAAVRPEVMKGAVLTVPEGLAKGEESKVSLALPANLMDVIKREAGKLGLGKAAKKAEVSASLTGEGYEITPNGAQTQPLKAGEAARFDWKVKPGAGDKAPLKAAVDGTLTGDKKAKTTFSLASLEQAVAPIVEEAKAATKGFKFPSLSLPKLSLKSLAIPGMKPVALPVVGQVPSEKLVGAGLALLALLLVIAMARNASAGRARAERRRKFRTMQDYGRVEADPEPAHAPVSQPYVNPMIAAAGGAVAGAAVAHAAQDDHGHHDAHAPETHGHDAHGADGHHDDHGHGADHGHGHDAHPVAHHPEPAHDDHGHDAHAADAHAPQAHAHDDHGHGDHAHGADHGADHGHGHDAHPVAHHPEPAHDDHGHDAHGHDAHAADGHAPEAHAHDDHGHGDHGHGADHHHPEPAHA